MSTRPLLFDWPSRHTLQVMMPVMLVLAAVFHAGIFFVFSVIYPSPKPSTLTPVQVYVPAPGSPEAQQLASILRANDPAVFAPGLSSKLRDAPLATQPQTPAAPLVLVPAPAPVAPPEEAQPWVYPRLVAGREESAANRQQVPSAPTRIALSPALEARRGDASMGFDLEAPAGFSPETAKFLIRVRADGRVANVFMQSGSGSPVLDSAATRALSSLSFLPAADDTWGVARFLWGDEIRTSPEQ